MDRALPREALPGGTLADTAVPGPQRPAPSLSSGTWAAPRVNSFAGGPWSLPWSPTACARARTVIRDVLPHWGLGDLVPTAELLVSELVSNALRHAAGPLRLTLERVSDLRCLVSDGTSESPRPTEAGPEDENGRGLALVEMLAARWGCEYGIEGKSVWFELSGDACTSDSGGGGKGEAA